MKNSFLTITKTIGLASILLVGALTYSSCTKTKGCKNTLDDKYDAIAEESDSTLCNESATTGKFVGAWTFTVAGTSSTYTVNVVKNGDYMVTIQTNFGLTGGIAAINIPASVDQNKATNSGSVDVPGTGNGEVSNIIMTSTGTSAATIQATFTNFTTTSINGTYTDSGTK